MQKKIKDDTISRQDAINVVSEGCQEWRGIFERCKEKLLALPSVQPEPKWIPVSERLPEAPYGCLVTIHWQDQYSGEYDQIYHEMVGYDGEGWNDSKGWTLPYEITAWMPLPEPYWE